MSSHPLKFVLYTAIILVMAAGLYFWFPRVKDAAPDSPPVACTEEAKLCPDGTYVGRTGPNCEFAACPEMSITTHTTTTINFEYPETLTNEYVSTVDWPPQVQVLNQSFTCTESGEEFNRTGKTEKRVINGREYCVTTVSEGAAGSKYTQYAYAFEKNNQTVIFTFTLRFVQCLNYDEPRQNACITDQTIFDVDKLVDTMAQSVES